MNCVFCEKEVSVKEKVGRRDTCPHCKHDLRCCRQCDYYDPHAYNDCKGFPPNVSLRRKGQIFAIITCHEALRKSRKGI
jgi:hypothetical protein